MAGPTVGVKAVEVGPEAVAEVRVPRVKDNLRAGFYFAAPQAFGLSVFAHHHRDGGVKLQSFPEDIAGEFQAQHGGEISLAASAATRARASGSVASRYTAQARAEAEVSQPASKKIAT